MFVAELRIGSSVLQQVEVLIDLCLEVVKI